MHQLLGRVLLCRLLLSDAHLVSQPLEQEPSYYLVLHVPSTGFEPVPRRPKLRLLVHYNTRVNLEAQEGVEPTFSSIMRFLFRKQGQYWARWRTALCLPLCNRHPVLPSVHLRLCSTPHCTDGDLTRSCSPATGTPTRNRTGKTC